MLVGELCLVAVSDVATLCPLRLHLRVVLVFHSLVVAVVVV